MFFLEGIMSSIVEKWDIFEIVRCGKREGNPFQDYKMLVTFQGEHERVTINGFYDGNGTYRARFMPSYAGVYTYEIQGDFCSTIEDPSGEFEVCEPSDGNHGPVQVYENVHFAYADGSPYYSIGTTCYAWVMQAEEMQEQTLHTLQDAAFNKIRFCIFPKFYEYNTNAPHTFPFETGNGEGLDLELVKNQENDQVHFPGMKTVEPEYGYNYLRYNTRHFQLLDVRIRQLRELGIEADLILMHPYDRWGINQMGREACDAYLKYVIARYAAYRNVWWSLANEYDFIRSKKATDWERYGQLVTKFDRYHHLLSIHNGMQLYDYSKTWITHCSLQRTDFYITTEATDQYIEKYQKPVVWDEICYEGNIGLGWGNITGQELVRRFWEGALRGGHVGHGETFDSEEEKLWWSHGGVLHGESAPRLAFLKMILEQTPGMYLEKGEGFFDEVVGYSGKSNLQAGLPCYDYAIRYLGICQPVWRPLILPDNEVYHVELIDTWNMIITDLGEMSGFQRITMPGRQFMAIRIQKV